MRIALPSLVLLLIGAAPAATLRGTVVENQTGHALAHASVLLEPVSGSGGVRMTGRTDRYGAFEFAGTRPGVYILQATREPFLTAYYGQKRWNSAGMPLTVTESETQFVTIRMMRFAAIAGRLVDENDVGQRDVTVTAYRDSRPLQVAAHATADERGVFRISGLLPGTYLVRSMGKELEGIGYKPTFSHETDRPDEARRVDVDIEEEAREIKLRPLPGQLFKLSVTATPTDPPEPCCGPVTLTLVSEMGRQVMRSGGYTFTGLPAGEYEIFAEATTESPDGKQGAYQRIYLGRDSAAGLTLRKILPVAFQFDGLPSQADSDGTVKLLGRRKDLAGGHDTQIVKLTNHRATLAVGPWEFAVAPIDGYYVSDFSGPGGYRSVRRFDGWNEATINGNETVRFTLSSSPGAVHGTVSDTGDPVAGAPVFMEPVDLDPARRLTASFVAITDIHGQYRFTSLAPGKYRVLSTFEYQMPDSKIMTEAGARELQIGGTDTALDVGLYVIR